MRMATGVLRSLAGSALTRIFHRAPQSGREQLAALVERSYEEITYHRLAARGFRPAAIVDVGAYHGNWSRLANRILGSAPTLMVEAQPDMLPQLEIARAALADAAIANCVLGERAGEAVTFYQMGTGSSLYAEASNVGRKELHLVTRTLDEVCSDFAPQARDLFLKIDVQGAELAVLRGGLQTLARCGLVQLEVALLQYNKGAPLLPEVVGFMAGHGFYPIEVSGFSRPRDQLVQIDLLFAPEGSFLRPTSFTF